MSALLPETDLEHYVHSLCRTQTYAALEIVQCSVADSPTTKSMDAVRGEQLGFTPGDSRNVGNEAAACASYVDAVGSPSGLCASIAEVVSSACATRPPRAQARANARLVQSICLDYQALTSPAPSNTFPLSCNRYRSSSSSLIRNLISFICVRVITIMRQNYFWSADPPEL
jgi:hypothetical protein